MQTLDGFHRGGYVMKNAMVRIQSVTIENFKNIGYGHLTFENARKNYAASILGLYGQNGSGKTGLIDAIALLRHGLCGQAVPRQFLDYINTDAESAKFTFEFKIVDTETQAVYLAEYSFGLREESDDTHWNVLGDGGEKGSRAVIFDEVFRYSYEAGSEKKKMTSLIDTRTALVFAPKAKYDCLVGREKATETNLIVAKRIASMSSRSFVFSRELLTIIRKNCGEKQHVFVLNSIVNFGNFELFIIQTTNVGLISLNALPLSFQYTDHDHKMLGNMAIPLNQAATIPKETVQVVKQVIDHMNIVLREIIPGLTISVRELGEQMGGNNQIESRIQLMSNRNGREIPLLCESEGIKKIISILQLLIVVYNERSITVAIDELDSGVFEYLLGEILEIISEKGKGQLIFTSHNLRPLETIDRGFIAFTTTNPQNRYIRFNNVKANNNLRDFYYRDIVLGEQSETVYEPTNSYDISFAFREAGEIVGP